VNFEALMAVMFQVEVFCVDNLEDLY